MEFIKKGKNYLIKNSNGRVVDEKTKLELENKELVIKDITSCGCQAETTKKISKNKKRIKEIEKEEIIANVEFSVKPLEPKAIIKNIKALQDEVSNESIEETISTD